MNRKRKRKVIMLALLGAAVLLPTGLWAQQEGHGGMLSPDGNNEHRGVFGRGGLFDWGLDDEDFGTTPDGDINVEDFGTPLGSGALVLLTAAAGYATLKTRNKKTNQQERNKK